MSKPSRLYAEARFANLTRHKQAGYQLIVIIMALGALASLGEVVVNTARPYGSVDFYQFWYYGNFIRQGHDPWYAYCHHERMPHAPRFLDSPISSGYEDDRFNGMPVNTAPLQLGLTLFSYFSWPTAKSLWMVLSIAVTICIPLFALRLAKRYGICLDRRLDIVAALGFYCMGATRNAGGNGQTTTIVFLLMLLSLLFARDRPWVAGALLGVALSKYSVAIPVLLLLLVQRRYLVAAVALLTQALAVLFISAISHHAVSTTLVSYWHIFVICSRQRGALGLSVLFPRGSLWSGAANAAATLAIYGLLFRWFSRSSGRREAREGPVDFCLLVVLSLWTLLIAYHRGYDAEVTLLAFILAFSTMRWMDLSVHRRRLIGACLFISLLLICLPGDGLAQISPIDLPPVPGRPIIILLLLLALSMYALRHRLRSSEITQGLLPAGQSSARASLEKAGR